jgi:hypothetical protein
MTFYGDCIKMCEDFSLNFGNEITVCCIKTKHILTLPLSSGAFQANRTRVSPPSHFIPLRLFAVSPIDDAAILTQRQCPRQNRRRCWTYSQNMTSRMHLNHGRSTGKGAYEQKGDYLWSVWEPSTKRQESGRGLVTWPPSRVAQQWRTGYLTTEQSNATMRDWLPGYRAP